jgi:hypothetical protein
MMKEVQAKRRSDRNWPQFRSIMDLSSSSSPAAAPTRSARLIPIRRVNFHS